MSTTTRSGNILHFPRALVSLLGVLPRLFLPQETKYISSAKAVYCSFFSVSTFVMPQSLTSFFSGWKGKNDCWRKIDRLLE